MGKITLGLYTNKYRKNNLREQFEAGRETSAGYKHKHRIFNRLLNRDLRVVSEKQYILFSSEAEDACCVNTAEFSVEG